MRRQHDPTVDVGSVFGKKALTDRVESIGTILASAVAMRTSASTCIRSKAGRFRTIIGIHVSRSPKGVGGDQTTFGLREPSIFPVANRLTAVAVSSKTCSPRLHFQRCTFWDDALLNEAPQGDRQFSCKSNDANLASAHPLPAKSLMPPKRQLAVWLVAEPEPRQLDERLPRELGTCFLLIPRSRLVSPLA
jgi:hypothetical protein